MATLTIRNIPEDAKHRFRQIAAAHGRSMEEHLRQMVIQANFDDPMAGTAQVAEAAGSFRPQPTGADMVRELIRIADGAGEDTPDAGRYAAIRFKTAKKAIAELRRLANGAEFDPPPRLSTKLEAPDF